MHRAMLVFAIAYLTHYTISSQVVVALAREHQMGGPVQPLSLLYMNTPEGIHVTEEDVILRGRALHLGQEFSKETSTAEAIKEVTRMLLREGLDTVSYGKELQNIRDQLVAKQQPYSDDVVLYHALLWKTGGDNGWTLKRNTGECQVKAFLPHVLEANKLDMSAEMCFQGEHIKEGVYEQREDISRIVPDPENWREISILEFVNGCLPGSKVSSAVGPTSQPIVQIVTSKDENLTWKTASESDNQTDEDVFVNYENCLYVRTNSDIRKLYEGRPLAVREMRLGQLACEYRLLAASDCGYEKTRSLIDTESKVGPNTTDPIVGTANGYAPQSIMVKGERILKRRENAEAYAVPHLLYSGRLDSYGNQLLWTPWDQLENVNGDQDENETENQARVRLSMFPMSVFPSLPNDAEVTLNFAN